MPNFFFADVLGRNAQVGVAGVGEVAEQAFDGRDRAIGSSLTLMAKAFAVTAAKFLTWRSWPLGRLS
jgi:hypothetical protein